MAKAGKRRALNKMVELELPASDLQLLETFRVFFESAISSKPGKRCERFRE